MPDLTPNRQRGMLMSRVTELKGGVRRTAIKMMNLEPSSTKYKRLSTELAKLKKDLLNAQHQLERFDRENKR